tara:strand:+ start:169961 stop:170419 length:459 start_codon:yes stop_codon:yes gene_type:complete
MKNIIFVFFLATSIQVLSKNKVTEKPFYGKEILAKKAIALDRVLKNYSEFEKKDVVMEASVEKVCAKKGCWMTLQGSDKTFRVKFHDYSYFVPMSLTGKKVWVEGEVIRKTISVDDTRHYLEDAGASKKEIAAVTKPSFEYRIMAKGVRVVK